MAFVASEEGADDVGVENGSACCDGDECVDQRADVEDAIFEEVAEAVRVGPCERGGVTHLERLGEQDDTDLWPLVTHADRGLGAFVGEGWWHPDVDDGDVWLVVSRRC